MPEDRLTPRMVSPLPGDPGGDAHGDAGGDTSAGAVAPAGRARVGREDVSAGLRRLGLQPGDTVFFHSSLRSLGYAVGGAGAVIDGFCEAVGPGGTVVVPTFTLLGRVGPFGSWYDHESSPSTVGAITETLRHREGAVRSFHPIHSVAAVGRRAVEVTAPHRDAYGRVSPWCDAAFAHGSPLDLLARWDAWYVLLGVGFNVQTAMHYAETIIVDAVLQRAPPAARASLQAQVRRWGTAGVWPSLDRVRLGEALVAAGTYASTRVGDATVCGAPLRAVLREALGLVLGDPASWLSPAFREWMGSPPDAGALVAAYSAPAGVPPFAGPALAPGAACAGHGRPEPPPPAPP